MNAHPDSSYAAPPSRHLRQFFASIVKYGFYPLALGLTLLFIHLQIHGVLGPRDRAYPLYLGLTISTMVALEWLLPARRTWSMTLRDWLRRDLPMLMFNGATIAATNAGITALARWAGAGSGAPTHALPWWGEAIAAILISDFLWYWVHRHSHEGRGSIGRWLWQTHVLHHLPERVYVFMHAVGHPLNTAYVRVILMLPAIALGFSEDGVFAAAVLTGFQGLVSHFNVAIRAGWLNHVFIGTELHRFHHSADPREGKNYAAVVALWDQLFGTFAYHPGREPAALGVPERDAYPEDGQWRALWRSPGPAGSAEGPVKAARSAGRSLH